MTTLTPNDVVVTGGVDTHQDLHVAAALDQVGRLLGTHTFPTTAAGYRQLLTWLRGHGRVERVGVEGTGSYGAALARHLSDAGVQVLEVARPNRQVRRRHGKTDVVDAVAAARAVQSGEATGTPKTHDGPVEALRTLQAVQRSGNKARTQGAQPDPPAAHHRTAAAARPAAAAHPHRPARDLRRLPDRRR